MTIVRVDDVSVPPGAKTFAGYLEAIGPNYQIQITLEESDWIQPVMEHIRVFIHGPLAPIVLGPLVSQIVTQFFCWIKEQREKRSEQDQQTLTIYGPDGKPAKVLSVKGDQIEEK